MQQAVQTRPYEAQQSDDVLEAKRRLESWGEWMRAIYDPNLGHKRNSPFTVVASGTAEYDDPAAEEIEIILAGMMTMSPRRVEQYRALLQCYYKHQSTRDASRDLKMGHSQYCKTLELGVNYVAVVLDERNKNGGKRHD